MDKLIFLWRKKCVINFTILNAKEISQLNILETSQELKQWLTIVRVYKLYLLN